MNIYRKLKWRLKVMTGNMFLTYNSFNPYNPYSTLEDFYLPKMKNL